MISSSTVTVEFASEETAPAAAMPATYTVKESYSNDAPVTAMAVPPAGDDGFATEFGNPNYRYRPPPKANATMGFLDSYFAQYPTIQVTPI